MSKIMRKIGNKEKINTLTKSIKSKYSKNLNLEEVACMLAFVIDNNMNSKILDGSSNEILYENEIMTFKLEEEIMEKVRKITTLINETTRAKRGQIVFNIVYDMLKKERRTK